MLVKLLLGVAAPAVPIPADAPAERARPTAAIRVERRLRLNLLLLFSGTMWGDRVQQEKRAGEPATHGFPQQFAHHNSCAHRYLRTALGVAAPLPVRASGYCGERRKYLLRVSSCCW